MLSQAAVLEDLVELAESDPQLAIADATGILESDHPESVGRVQALRAIGIARRALGDAHGSVDSLERAREEALPLDDPQLLGEVEFTLAWSASLAGDLRRAHGLLDAAESRVDRRGQGRIMSQRASLVARSGDLPGSLPIYAEAESALLGVADERSLAALYANRGLVHTYLGDFARARIDIESARDLYLKLDYVSSAAEMTHNLGFLAVQQGKIPEALAFFDEAEEQFRDLEMPVSELLLDRAEALLLVGLAEEAQHLALRAANNLADAGMNIELGEALIMEARAAFARGDLRDAIETASEADRLMKEQDRPGWRLRAQYLGLASRAASGDEVDALEFGRLADELSESGQLFPSLHARLLAGRAAIQRGDHEAARRELTVASKVRSSAPVDMRLQAWLATALLRRSEGNFVGAGSAVRAGVRMLDEYRATLGATESRVNVTRHASELMEMGLEMAYASGRPSRLLSWVDRSRSGLMRLVPARPPEDEEMAQALTELRSAQQEVREAEAEGDDPRRARSRQARAERRIRRISMRQGGPEVSPLRPESLKGLQRRLDGRAMVVFVEVGDELVSIRVRDRSIRIIPIGPSVEVSRDVMHLIRALRLLALRGEDAGASVVEEFARGTRALDDRLFGPLRLGDEQLIVVPTASLHSLPWASLPSFAERISVVAPSPYAWSRAQEAPDEKGSALLAAGPRLSQAIPEIDALAGIYADANVLKEGEATVESVLTALNGCAIAHLACHGRFRPDNAMFSSLELIDGELTVYDIETIRHPPQTIVLSACESGLSETSAGEELMGLAVALLGIGAKDIIVSVVPLPDADPTRALMKGFHSAMHEGLAPPAALRAAQSNLPQSDTNSLVARSGLFCLGA